VDPADDGEAAESEADNRAAAAGTGDDGEHGLGWLLKQHGLGAVTVAPGTDPAAVEEQVADEAAPEVPVDGSPGAAEPVSAAPAKQNWFAPVTDTKLIRPEPADQPGPGIGPADEAPGSADATPADVTPADEPARQDPTDAATPAEEPRDTPAEAALPDEPQDTTAAVARADEPHDTTAPVARPDEPHDTTAPVTRTEGPQDTPAQAGPTGGPQGTLDKTAASDEPQNVSDEQRPDAGHEVTTAPEPETAPEAAAAHPATAGHPQADVRPATGGRPEPHGEQGPGTGTEPAAAGPDLPVAGSSSATDFARQPGRYGDHAPRRLVDPEQVLASYPWRLSPGTLREVIDEPGELLAVRDRLTDKLEYAERDAVRARLLSLRAVVSRVLGDLDFALADGRAALTHAEATGELRRTAIVRVRLAHVLRWRGEFAEADRLFEEANSVELPARLRAEMYELAGRSAFDQGRHLEAVNRFEQALELRRHDDDAMVSRIEVALDAITRRARDAGWGPYPRSADEILQRPAREEIWPDDRYAQVRPFSDGLAWVSRDAEGGWFAIDRQNRVIVPGGFEDVGPFRHGVAPVRRGGWGAIDRHGRMVVQPKYRRFATALPGGRRVDGFTEEGLAVVDAGDRLGVVDRTGQLLVPPVHAALVIHPVAFLIGDRAGRWGALDRNGEPLVEVRHRSEADVTDEMDRLLSDTRPVL
jgi:hypothetical protein